MSKKENHTLKIQSLDIELVVPYELNARLHKSEQVAHIAESIEEFGFNQPIVIDENRVVLVGHGRLEAAKKLGLKKVPVVIAEGLTDLQKRAYRIVDNKLQNDSSWDFFSLRQEFDVLSQEAFDFSQYDLKALEDYAAAYRPNLEPEVAPIAPTDADIEKKSQELNAKYEGSTAKLEVCCPNCAEVFYIDKPQ